MGSDPVAPHPALCNDSSVQPPCRLITATLPIPNMAREIDLCGVWRLNFFNPGTGSREKAYAPGYGDEDWLEARVPGDVHLDLTRHGLLPDPYYGLNFRKHYWVEEKEWWYRRRFRAPKEGYVRAFLVFEGVDTLCTAWLNGVELGSHGNMFTPWRIDVTGLLEEENIIALRILPVKNIHRCRRLEAVRPAKAFDRLFTRKAQMCFGWDIAPRLVTAGVWRPVKLLLTGWGEILSVAVRHRLKNGSCILHIHAEIANYGAARRARLEAAVEDDDGVAATAVKTAWLASGLNTVSLRIRLEKPKLWWPWDKGDPHLYTLKLLLDCGEDAVDSKRLRFGLRSVELVTREDGRSVFYFKINGAKVYARGFNWTPPDSIFARTTPREYRRLLKAAREANANMVRVWGGGIYPPDEFYDTCDELGVMVWQDFMYACGAYPRDHWFLMEAREEAVHVVKRLRNHPSIVLWCGDNENDAIFHPEGHPLNRLVLSSVCRLLDPDRPYWPSSPSGGARPNDPREGDTHIWHHGEPYLSETYRRELLQARFISEIGHLSCPSIPTMKSFLPREGLWPPSDAWKHHFGTLDDEHAWFGDPQRREKMEKAMESFWGSIPESLEEYVYVSQLLQALAYKTWIEEARLNKVNGGILVWNLTDSWPQFSDSVIDYYRRPKLAYFLARLAFKPLHVILKPGDGKGKTVAYIVNDYRSRQHVLLVLERAVHQGSREKILEKNLYVEPCSAVKACEVAVEIRDPSREYVLARLLRDNVEISRNILCFTSPRSLAFRYEEPLLGRPHKID